VGTHLAAYRRRLLTVGVGSAVAAAGVLAAGVLGAGVLAAGVLDAAVCSMMFWIVAFTS